jgi:biotin-dependent carboxylase-like uncharacterized protein
MTGVVIRRAGLLTTVQDLGRPGHAAVGVTTGGAADRAALRLANRLLGNPDDAAGLECLLGGVELEATGPLTVAVAGAPAPLAVNGSPEPGPVVHLGAGDRLRVGAPVRGLRCYLAVAGGIQGPLLLGSRGSSPTSGLGPAPLARGDELTVGAAPAYESGSSEATDVGRWADAEVVVSVILGPRADWFEPASVDRLTHTAWEVTSDVDRVGIRLSGPELVRVRDAELPSEGIVRGAVQVPPSGQPIVFLADHPTTGGYPVLAVVVDSDPDRLAQVRPGARVRFALRTPGWS